MSPAVTKAFKTAFGKRVNVSRAETASVWDDEAHYYTQVGE
jgi:hypothetical protein